MIYNGKYVDLELVQISNDANHATLQLKIKRTNPYYYNREGIIVTLKEGKGGYPEDHWIYYTSYDPKAIVKKGYVGTDTPTEVEADYFEQTIEFTIDPDQGTIRKRYGNRVIEVWLKENTADERSETYVYGFIELKTLEVPLPVVHNIEVTFSATEIYKKVTAINPQGLYDLKLLSSHEGGIILDPTDLDHTSTIQPQWRGQEITYIARFTLGTSFIAEKEIKVTVPSDQLFLYVKDEEGFHNVDAVFEGDGGGVHDPVLAVWFKNAGEWTTQD